MTGTIRPYAQAHLGDVAGAVAARLKTLEQIGAVARMWQRDHTLWKPDPAEITNRLDWLTLPETMAPAAPDLAAFGRRCEGFDRIVLMGMGGSSLAPEVLSLAGGKKPLLVLDSTHPQAVLAVERSGDLRRTLFIVASKSGATVETHSQFRYFFQRAPRGDQFVAITDPGSPLETLAGDHGFLRTFLNPEGVGGRYSALSYFGLAPAAVMGIDAGMLLESGRQMAAACTAPGAGNPGLWLGAAIGEAALRGRDKLTLLPASAEDGFGSWVEQLIAESTGKEGRGIIPVVEESTGRPGAYGADRLFVAAGEAGALAPAVELPGRSLATLGGEFFRWEFATAVAGHILGINAFDQPNVEEAKAAARAVLAGGGAAAPTAGDLRSTLSGVGPGAYLGILAYLPRTNEHHDRLQRVRLALRDRLRVATTLGFGPRYLHSTGQLHKGGPASGVFIQVMDRPSEDAAIPGQSFTFRQLLDAQADGDLAALRGRGRRAVRVSLEQLEQEV